MVRTFAFLHAACCNVELCAVYCALHYALLYGFRARILLHSSSCHRRRLPSLMRHVIHAACLTPAVFYRDGLFVFRHDACPTLAFFTLRSVLLCFDDAGLGSCEALLRLIMMGLPQVGPT